MRNFNTRFRLLDIDRQIRLVYTFFIAITGAGFMFTLYWAYTMNGLSYDGVVAHYLGSDSTFGEPKSFYELAETTHFHLFTMPVVFLILVLLYQSAYMVWDVFVRSMGFVYFQAQWVETYSTRQY